MRNLEKEMLNEIWTIGHSNKPLEGFVLLLRSHQIEALADVRRFPGSRRYPHFNGELLANSLAGACIEYSHFPELGGRRPTRKDSPNTAWRNDAFRGYADFMMTEEFQRGIERLLGIAEKKRTAVMCAEALWWQCHRSLIADFLKARGMRVWHIMGEAKVEEHPYTSPARIVDGKLSYAAAETALELGLD
jgi:uncharacterized protein (DUF488 family)